MFRKARIIGVLCASIIASSFVYTLPEVLAAENLFTTKQVVRLEGKARDEYVAKKMNAMFHPKDGVRPPVKPFEAPEGYSYEKMELNGAKIERLQPNKKHTDRVVLQFHGGGYVNSLGNQHRNLAVLQSQMAGGAETYMLDYRTIPTNRYPAALEDAVNAYKGLLDRGYQGKNILVIGDSAGANLVMSLALYIKDHNMSKPGALVLISPWLMMENTLPSRSVNFDKDVILGKGTPLVGDIIKPRYAEGADLRDPYLSPLYGDFKGLPPMLIQTGEYETLVDDSLLLAKKAEQAGVKVVQTTYKGMSHDFAVCLPNLAEARASWKELQSFVQKHLS